MIDRAEWKRVFGLANPGMLPTWGDRTDATLAELAADLENFIADYEKRFGEKPDPIGLFNKNPEKGRAFLQFDTLGLSGEMKVMVWRILLGCEIRQVDFRFQVDGSSSLRVVLQTPYGEPDPPYDGVPVTDFRVLRHFGAVGHEGRLLLHGYYALR